VAPDRPVHSLQAYFIRPGDPAIQHGRTIFTLSASFHRAEPGPSHSDAMPEVPPLEGIPRTVDRLERLFGTLPAPYRDSPIDVRHVGPLTFEAERDPALRRTDNLGWLRVEGCSAIAPVPPQVRPGHTGVRSAN
jgi:acyl-CoA thioesterase-2